MPTVIYSWIGISNYKIRIWRCKCAVRIMRFSTDKRTCIIRRTVYNTDCFYITWKCVSFSRLQYFVADILIHPSSWCSFIFWYRNCKRFCSKIMLWCRILFIKCIWSTPSTGCPRRISFHIGIWNKVNWIWTCWIVWVNLI